MDICSQFVPGSYQQRNSFQNLRTDTESGIITVFEGEGKPEE